MFDLAYKTIITAQGGQTPPYAFKWVPPADMKPRDSFSLQSVKTPTEQGIYSEAKGLLPIIPRNAIRQKIDHDLPDAGLILLCLDYEKSNTTVIGLGGWGGPATLGSVQSLLRSTKDLNPFVESSDSKSVIKPVFVTFRKETDTPYDDRRLTNAKLLIIDNEFGEAIERARELIGN